MSARFCPNCDAVLSIWTTGWDYGEVKTRNYGCESCGYHQTQPEENKIWNQTDMDKFFRAKKHIALARAKLNNS